MFLSGKTCFTIQFFIYDIKKRIFLSFHIKVEILDKERELYTGTKLSLYHFPFIFAINEEINEFTSTCINLLPIFWEFAVNHVVFLINSISTPLLNNITPHEQLFGKPYDISFLKVFGCLCYASTITAHRKKLDDRSIKCIFLGFPQNTKGYIVLNLKFHRIEISRHVIFHETHFPYKLDGGLPRDPNTLSLPISNAKLSTFLLSNKYSISVADHSFFLKYNNDKLTVILVYVDDLVLIGDDTEEINTITASLHHHFKIKNLGNLTDNCRFAVKLI